MHRVRANDEIFTHVEVIFILVNLSEFDASESIAIVFFISSVSRNYTIIHQLLYVVLIRRCEHRTTSPVTSAMLLKTR